MNRLARGAALTVFVVAALAAGRAVTDAMPTEPGALKGAAAPFVVDAEVGDTTDLRYATVTVDRTRPAQGIEGTDAIATTPGHLLLVDLEVVAKDEPRVLGGFSLLADDGRRFHADRRWPVGSIPTGVPWHVTVVFEVPADAIEGATLEVAEGHDWWTQRRDHVLHVDLGLDERDAAAYASNRDIAALPANGLNAPETTPVGEMPDE